MRATGRGVARECTSPGAFALALANNWQNVSIFFIFFGFLVSPEAHAPTGSGDQIVAKISIQSGKFTNMKLILASIPFLHVNEVLLNHFKFIFV